jgi:outer membrane protein assembly factor BamB
MTMRAIVKLAIGVLLAASIATGARLPSSAAGPVITLKPSSGPPTTSIKVQGTGFSANEAVDTYFDTTDMVLASADSTGAFSISFRAPATAQPGKHYVSAVGRTSGLSAQTAFTVRTNWAEFHFGPGLTGLNPYENTLTTSNVSGMVESWAFATGGSVESSPAVAGGMLYIGSDNGKVYALNATTGALKWGVATGGAVKSSPAVAGNVVYVGSEDGKVYALNVANGSAKWTDDLSSLEPAGFDSAPIVYGGKVYIGGRSANVYALDATTGFADWAVPGSCGGWSSTALTNNVVYVNDLCDGILHALSSSTGAQLWTQSPGGFSPPTVGNGVVYTGGLGEFSGISAANGNVRWNDNGSFSDDNFSTAALANGVVYVGTSLTDSNLYALSASTGTLTWTFKTAGQIFSSPAVADGVVYVGSNDANVYAVSASTGGMLWSATTGGSVVSSPAVANGHVYVGSNDGAVYAYSLLVPPSLPSKPAPATLQPNGAWAPRL